MPSLSLQHIYRVLRRRFWIMFFVVAVITTAVGYMTFTATPLYKARSTIIVDHNAGNAVDIGLMMTGVSGAPEELETELQVITSPVLLERVVRKMELHKFAEFNPSMQEPSQVGEFKYQLKNFISGLIPGGSSADEEAEAAAAAERNMTETEREDAQIAMATRILLNKIVASRNGRTLIFTIEATSVDPAMAKELANTVADQYLVDQLDAKFDATKRANAWLEDQLGDLRKELNETEAAVEAYRSQEGLLSARGQTLTESQIAETSGQLIVQEANYSELLARLNNVREQIRRGTSETIAEAINSDVIRNLRVQLAQIIRERADLETRYGPRHPDMARIVAEEQDLQAQIDAEIQRVVTSLESETNISRQRVESLRASLNNLRDELSDNNRSLIRLRELERNRDASRTLYENFLNKFKEIDSQEGITEADARILSYAETPKAPALPRTNLNMALGIIMGLAMASALVLLLELLDNRVSSGEEIEESFGIPFLGNVPLLSGLGGARSQPGRYLVKHPMSAYAESMRNLRASVKFANIDKPARLVTVTSSFPNEGKTSLTFSLGRMSAMTGSRTLIIDGDFRRRQLTEMSGQKPEIGLIEYLLGGADLEDVIMRDTDTELDILPLSKSGNTTRDVFGSKAFDSLMIRLKAEYDMIIIDTAPILLMAETRVIAAKADQVLVAARWRRTNKASLQQTLSILREFHASVAGIVLTFVDLKRLGKHSGAALSNYKSYAKYYHNK